MARIQLRRGTAAQWTSANPVLLEGELGLETDTGKIKVGDGVANWNTTTYNVSSGSTVADITIGPDNPASGGGGLSYDGTTATLTFTPAVETTTSLSIAANVLTYTDEDGVDTDIDLSLYLDDTNLARIVSGVMEPTTRICTFTRDDGSTFDIDFSPVLHDIFRISVGADDSTLHEINSGESIKFIGGENTNTSSNTEGDITINVPFTGTFRGDLVGSVFADDSTTLIDGISGTIFKANIEDSGNWDTAFSWGDHSVVGYLTEETNDLSSVVTWADVPDANITQSSVTQHQAALSITESQISDLQTYALATDFGDIEITGNVINNNAGSEIVFDDQIQIGQDGGDNTLELRIQGIYNTYGNFPAVIESQAHLYLEANVSGVMGAGTDHIILDASNIDFTGATFVNSPTTVAGYNITDALTTATTLQDISDVTLTSIADGQALVYDSATSQWVNGTNGNDVYLVDGGTATSIYTSGDLELDGGGA